MKIRGTVLAPNDPRFPPGCIADIQRDVPVTIDCDPANVVGLATVYPDGSAEIDLPMPKDQDTDFGIGYRIEASRQEGDTTIVERLQPMLVSVSSKTLRRLGLELKP